jgi:aldose 1-epimerase
MLKNKSGVRTTITDYGAAVTSLFVPDRKGNLADVVLGYDSLDGYVNDKSYLGVIVGRYGNRIGKGRFVLEGKEYHLTINDGENHLHGGTNGFHKRLWKAEPMQTDTSQSLKLTLTSPDGDEGYPGKVTVEVTYTLTDRNELVIDYKGTTDQMTILNPTHHSYFNLTGSPTNTILDHVLELAADSITPVDRGLITTGELTSVENTPMDFRTSTRIGSRIDEQYDQLAYGKGYDHNWVIRNHDGTIRKVAELYDPGSGRCMTVLTDQPGMQFYSGNFLNGSIHGKGGITYQHRTGLCLEAQHYPDSPNNPRFPTVVVKPGTQYSQTTIYQFSTR